MAKKRSALDKAIDKLRDEVSALDVKRMHVLEMIDVLKAQQTARPVRTPKAKKEPVQP